MTYDIKFAWNFSREEECDTYFDLLLCDGIFFFFALLKFESSAKVSFLGTRTCGKKMNLFYFDWSELGKINVLY